MIVADVAVFWRITVSSNCFKSVFQTSVPVAGANLAEKNAPAVVVATLIDAATGAWIENVPDPGGRQAVALAANNHIFTPVQVTNAIVKDSSSDHTVCTQFGFRGTGCIAVFAHADTGANQNQKK